LDPCVRRSGWTGKRSPRLKYLREAQRIDFIGDRWYLTRRTLHLTQEGRTQARASLIPLMIAQY
jgi:hypothetical protein